LRSITFDVRSQTSEARRRIIIVEASKRDAHWQTESHSSLAPFTAKNVLKLCFTLEKTSDFSLLIELLLITLGMTR